ncbi:hypothetical protein ACS15_5601 [Ralstonia insidiosa]|uniref:Uncharacterized protein n=1 Tax=Ralstonia insidiosa TaxID=190721 RepID=A0AAC9BNV7_9RALS|nr:hypothetical protein ACS15_5601 [Ralstonia insidiosa]
MAGCSWVNQFAAQNTGRAAWRVIHSRHTSNKMYASPSRC